MRRALWDAATPGIPDAEFAREEGVPITKEEVRAIQVSKARIRRGATVIDVGCGSGSVTVEAALQAGEGADVHAIDSDARAVELTRSNLGRFGVKATVHHADARECVAQMPEADAILVGGMGGATAEVLALCAGRLRAGGRIVVGTILVETLVDVLGAVRGLPLEDVDITQVTIAKSRTTPTGTMMLARNPVTVVSATRAGAPAAPRKPGAPAAAPGGRVRLRT